MGKIKVGYLPLYIKLYDDSDPAKRNPMVSYMETMHAMLESQGLELVKAPVCRIKEEFENAIDLFHRENVCAVITQHLAYSPSLESIDALARAGVPLIILDTTPDYSLIDAAGYERRVSVNHGIHGVQDMCNLLRRRGIPYHLCVGHAMHSEVIAKAAGMCRAGGGIGKGMGRHWQCVQFAHDGDFRPRPPAVDIGADSGDGKSGLRSHTEGRKFISHQSGSPEFPITKFRMGQDIFCKRKNFLPATIDMIDHDFFQFCGCFHTYLSFSGSIDSADNIFPQQIFASATCAPTGVYDKILMRQLLKKSFCRYIIYIGYICRSRKKTLKKRN